MHVAGDTYPARGTSQACTERDNISGIPEAGADVEELPGPRLIGHLLGF
jgi:hypothetical protein